MSENVLESSHRLKYKGRYVELKLKTGSDGLLDLSVLAPVSGTEKSSFNKVAVHISKLVYSGVRSRGSILGQLDRMVGVDHDVLNFMRKVVSNVLELSK